MARATVYDIGAVNANVVFNKATDSLTNTGSLTAWTDSTLSFSDNVGTDVGVDFTALGITSWTTAKWVGSAVTKWDGANLSGLTLTFTGHNFGYNDSMKSVNFSGATITHQSYNQSFLFCNLTDANFSGATLNLSYTTAAMFRGCTLTRANFSDITWGIAASGVISGSFFSGGPGTTSAADKADAVDFSGADLSRITGAAKTAMIANLGKFDGTTAIGAKYNASMLSKSGWAEADLVAAGWQLAAPTVALYILSN
jgi:uncharacterized protein YjbI with pentapeptide repeats